MDANFVGIYKVIESSEPCFLIEMIVPGDLPIKFSEFTQEDPTQPRANWQVPYDENILNDDGTKVIVNGFKCEKPEYWNTKSQRIAFFFFYLNLNKEFITPFGKLSLPKEISKPERLNIIKFEPPF